MFGEILVGGVVWVGNLFLLRLVVWCWMVVCLFVFNLVLDGNFEVFNLCWVFLIVGLVIVFCFVLEGYECVVLGGVWIWFVLYGLWFLMGFFVCVLLKLIGLFGGVFKFLFILWFVVWGVEGICGWEELFECNCG